MQIAEERLGLTEAADRRKFCLSFDSDDEGRRRNVAVVLM